MGLSGAGPAGPLPSAEQEPEIWMRSPHTQGPRGTGCPGSRGNRLGSSQPFGFTDCGSWDARTCDLGKHLAAELLFCKAGLQWRLWQKAQTAQPLDLVPRGGSDAGTRVVPVARAGGKGSGAQRVQAGGPATSQRPPSLGRPPASLCCLLKLTDEAVDI